MEFFEENSHDWDLVAEEINAANCVYITCHINPDGDAIGSEMALAGYLKNIGKSYRVINHSPTPDTFKYLDPDDSIELFSDISATSAIPGSADLIIMLDMGKFDRCGSCMEYFKKSKARKVVIDHHPKEKIDADLVVVNTNAASTGSLVYAFLNHIDPSTVNSEIALAIMTALVTDSGYFRYANTTSVTHRIAASLYEHGVSSLNIRRRLETGYPFSRQKLMGLALSNLSSAAEGRISYTYITLDMFDKAEAKREHTDGFIDQMRYINGTQVAFLVVQEEEERFKVSFRSGEHVAVNMVASMLGGGGHPRAAGANLIGSLDDVIMRVLEAAESYLND